MQKTTSSSSKNDKQNCLRAETTIQPKKSTIENIMAFAASYHAQEIEKNHFVELILN